MDSQSGQFKNFDEVQGQASKPSRPKWHIPTLLWLLFATAIGFAGLVLGAWATDKAKRTSSDLSLVTSGGVFLSNKPSHANSDLVFEGSLFAGSGYWSKEPDLMYLRSDHGTVSRGDAVYVFGGLSNITTPNATAAFVLNRLVKYDTYTGKSVELKSMPEPRYRFGYGTIGDNLYVFGGFNEEEVGVVKPVGTTLKYDFNADTWEALPAASNLQVARSDLCAAGVQGKLYAVGGWNGDYSTPLGSVEEFDPTTGKWSSIANNLFARGDCKAVNINDVLFVMGGVVHIELPGKDCNNNDWLACNPFTNTTEMYNPSTKKWVAKASMLNARGDFAATTMPDHRVFVAGGETGVPGVKNQVAMRLTEVYIFDDDAWIPKAPLPEARFRFDVSTIRNLVYAFGGHPTCGTGDADPANDNCYDVALKSVYAYLDVPHPHVYAFVHK